MQQREEPPDGGAPATRRREAGGWKAARWVRRAVQIAFLSSSSTCCSRRCSGRAAFPYADLFFRFDPLAAFSTMLAARQWLPHLALAVVTVVAALVLGRVWCGWICPLGTLLGWFRFRAARRLALRVPPQPAQRQVRPARRDRRDGGAGQHDAARPRPHRACSREPPRRRSSRASTTWSAPSSRRSSAGGLATAPSPGSRIIFAARCCPCTSRTTRRASPSSSSSSRSYC